MLLRRLWLPGLLVVAAFVAACGSTDTSAESASPTPAASTTALPTETATEAETTTPEAATPQPTTPQPTTPQPTTPQPTTPQATATGVPATTVPAPTAANVEKPTPLVQELDSMQSVQGGNVNQVYLGESHPPELAGIIASMIDDAVERSGVTADEVEVVAVADVTWSDASLGCGQPGFAYAQVLTDGMRVVLKVDDLFYDYRASGVDAFFLCSQSAALAENDASPAAADTGTDTGAVDKSSPGLYEITEDGVVQVEPPTYDDQAPTEGTNPPDK